MTRCNLCEQTSGHYDFLRLCCRVRFLLTLPNVEVRRAWLERWAWQGDKANDETKAAFEAEFKKRKNDAKHKNH